MHAGKIYRGVRFIPRLPQIYVNFYHRILSVYERKSLYDTHIVKKKCLPLAIYDYNFHIMNHVKWFESTSA